MHFVVCVEKVLDFSQIVWLLTLLVLIFKDFLFFILVGRKDLFASHSLYTTGLEFNRFVFGELKTGLAWIFHGRSAVIRPTFITLFRRDVDVN